MSQKKVEAVMRLERLRRRRRTVERWGKCIAAIGMLEVVEGVLRIESLYLELSTSCRVQ
jgi:hypothetical protein